MQSKEFADKEWELYLEEFRKRMPGIYNAVIDNEVVMCSMQNAFLSGLYRGQTSQRYTGIDKILNND